ncbi:MAG: glucose-6-phosphate dehydrogenase [Armatimonadetes bacterium]|nr:glucose-6-phosphate dehydrogenase [Armatimonadota bacterium]
MAEGGASGPALVRPDEDCAFVIFGASGDLTGRKLIPALYNLFCQGLLPPGFAVVGYAVTPMTDAEFRGAMREHVKASSEVLAFRPRLWDQFVPCLHYVTAGFDAPEGYRELGRRLAAVDAAHGTGGNRLFYMATAPRFFGPIVERLQEHGLAEGGHGGASWTRLVVEKPFGTDLASARALNESLHRVFAEDQIYRIDHYLGKETVQNLLAFRFANTIMEPIWNCHYVDHVQITAAETLGVEHRGGYYDQAGVLRDMFQNHLFQLLALVAMEPPVRYEGQIVRDRKADVLRAVVPLDPRNLAEQAVRGQYGPGHGMPGYRQEPDVAPDSHTETFAALKLMVDNWRWADTPFYLRSGKRMPKKQTLIAIQFKRVPHLFFDTTADDQIEPNVLAIRIQPDEGISLTLGAKSPGPEMHVRQMQMNFSYSAAFGEFPATAYETLLLDVMQGDLTLFNRSDTVDLSWELLAPVLDAWQSAPSADPFPNYPAGTWGPPAADALLARDGRAWKTDSTLPGHQE